MNKLSNFLIAGALITTPLLKGNENDNVKTYASFDIGSGETKMTVAKIDTENNKVLEIFKTIFKPVELKKNLDENNMLNEKIVSQLMQTLHDFKDLSSEYETTQWSGFGSSVFRTAKNGKEILGLVEKELNIPIVLLSQEEEGAVGFNAAIGVSGLDEDKVISWDSGSGSFQITTKIEDKLEMFGAEFAYVGALKALYDIRNIEFNPDVLPEQATLEEAFQIIKILQQQLPEVPVWFSDENKKMIAIGGSTSIFSFATLVTGEMTFSKDQLLKGLIDLLNENNKPREWPQGKVDVEVAVSLMLIYSIMDHCRIESVSYHGTNGGCEGFLLMPEYWKK